MAKIAFWLGSALEIWDPETAIDGSGIGGSETAAIRMAQELAKLGHDIEIYADVRERTMYGGMGMCGGVAFTPYRMVLGPTKPQPIVCDLFVSSRVAEARHLLVPICKQAWLWMHDLHCGPDHENLIGTTYDKILCLSSWARERFVATYPGVDEDKVALTRNGIDLERFAVFVDPGPPYLAHGPGSQHVLLQSGSQPLTAIYSSSPERGLDRLLDMWPKIRCLGNPESRSDGVLHVYYGFENWKKLADRHGNGYIEQMRIAALEARLGRTEGVVVHGRVGQRELARAFLTSHLWLYPTMFPEISCITAMEAQVAGCKIVATAFAVLPETAPHALFVRPPAHTLDYEHDFIETVKAALCEDVPPPGDLWTWERVARQWHEWITAI